jgi:hypothetical protein
MLDVEERIILKRILKKSDGMAYAKLIGLRIGEMAGCCEHGNEFCLP